MNEKDRLHTMYRLLKPRILGGHIKKVNWNKSLILWEKHFSSFTEFLESTTLE